jgi:hypothetical protein
VPPGRVSDFELIETSTDTMTRSRAPLRGGADLRKTTPNFHSREFGGSERSSFFHCLSPSVFRLSFTHSSAASVEPTPRILQPRPPIVLVALSLSPSLFRLSLPHTAPARTKSHPFPAFLIRLAVACFLFKHSQNSLTPPLYLDRNPRPRHRLTMQPSDSAPSATWRLWTPGPPSPV